MRRFSLVSVVVLSIAPALANAQAAACDDAGIKLPAGFCATIFADSIRGARQLAVAPNGDVFVAVSGQNGGVVALRDADKSGKSDRREQFVSGFGSSHIALFDGRLYVAVTPPTPQRGANNAPPTGPMPTTTIVRYAVKAGDMTPAGAPDTIVTGIPTFPGHSTRNFAITRTGVLYLNVGSATNSCQERDRAPRSTGVDPCVELETRAGVWKFDARKKNQAFGSANHFARGIRNAVGIAIDANGKLWTTQHGRDDLGSWFGALGIDSAAAIKYNAENPAEELMQVNAKDDFGWPYCFYAIGEKHLVLAPEYGGDGKKVGQCAQKKGPVATFPAHWAPNALHFYTGAQFPKRYKAGAFIAFHGSWNRAPEPQAGFNVVFQPIAANGKSSGAYEVFADGFAPNVGAGRATFAAGGHRPTAIAQGPDGALYIADDTGGRIYRITYSRK